MTQRPTLDQMTSDDLDALYARLADYENRITWDTTCASCARILDSSIRETERANQAEELLRIAHETSNKSEAERARTAAELEQAQAAIKRVRTLLAGRWGTVDPDRVRAALDPQDTP